MLQKRRAGGDFRSQLSRQAATAIAWITVWGLAGAGCGDGTGLPSSGSPEYREAVSAFHEGLAAMEASADAHAEEAFGRVARLAPGEPAVWADLGLLALRRNELESAAERLGRAAELAPDEPGVLLLRARLASELGRLEEAMVHLRRAIEVDSTHVTAMYALAREAQRHGGAGALDEALKWYDRILELRPDNLAVLLDLARAAAARPDAERLESALSRLVARSGSWPTEAREQLDALRTAVANGEREAAGTRVAFLRNVLLRTSEYRHDLRAVWTPTDEIGEPIEEFLRLPPPGTELAAADTGLAFIPQPASLEDFGASWAGALVMSDEAAATLWAANGRELRRVGGGPTLPFPGGPAERALARNGVVGIDLDNDFRTDLVLVGAGGLNLFRQDSSGGFHDVTRESQLPVGVTTAPYSAAWSVDLDLEGDLDLLLGSRSGPAGALINRGDGTFGFARPFASLDGLSDFAWTDLDGDGDPDGAVIDGAGVVHVLLNDRQAAFREIRTAAEAAGGLAAADIDRDGDIELLVLGPDGSIRSLAVDADGKIGTPVPIEGVEALPGDERYSHLMAADLDNNGALDLIASGEATTRIWLGVDGRRFRALPPLNGRILDVAGMDDDGRLDLVGLTRAGEPAIWRNEGERSYRWIRIRPRAASTTGDQRINSFGLGGIVEVRSGLLYQKRPIDGPVLHFGLGEHAEGEVVRILWPNGVLQAEFELAAGSTLRAMQRLKGSCPWVFAYDGGGMEFVTDFIWRSPLGMRINAQETAGVLMTGDRVRIGGEQLAARDGFYDIRITAELWETHFFDHVSLIAVDHPAGTEVFVDERFAVPPPSLEVRTTGPVRRVASARDHTGREVSEEIRASDGRYLDGFDRGRYQGLAEDHYVEIELGAEAPRAGPLWLVATGWVRPTDSSINLAISQGAGPRPRGLRLEVAESDGGWRTVQDDLGFPAGKSKTILIDLEDVFSLQGPRRIRLRTNLEVYWDRIGWAVGRPDVPTVQQHLAPATAELRYRGFSSVRGGRGSVPEIPVYEELAGTAPRWLDLVGYYTRFGDVRTLLHEVDDRYVIMNAGDELVLRFPALPPPARDGVRDFVLVGDGWVKDGDFNTLYSKTVRPLPEHAGPEYAARRLGPLEADHVYRRHRRDWRDYHTRYVTPDRALTGLAPAPTNGRAPAEDGER